MPHKCLETLYSKTFFNQKERAEAFHLLSRMPTISDNSFACMLKFDASLSPVYSHSPLLCLISHCLQLDVSLIYAPFLPTMDH